MDIREALLVINTQTNFEIPGSENFVIFTRNFQFGFKLSFWLIFEF